MGNNKQFVWVIPAILSAVSGCTVGMGDIDRRIDRVLGESSGNLGAFVKDPDWDPTVRAEQEVPPGEYQSKSTPTTNPAPEKLEYTPADEARDTQARLDRYLADQEGERLELTLADALRISQSSSREFQTAQEQYILSAISLLIQRHQFNPQFFNTTTLSTTGDANDGRHDVIVDIMNELGVSQNLERGGQVAASWILNASEDLRSGVSDRYMQSSELVLSGSFPLLRGAGLVASEALIQAERNLIYAARDFERFRRELFVDIASDYIRLLQQQASIMNQERRIESLENLLAETVAKSEAGQLRDFEVSIAESDLLDAQASLADLMERYRFSEDTFKIRIGLPVDQAISVNLLKLVLPDPDVTPTEATVRALEYRLDLQNTRDQVLDSRRDVANARNGLLPDLNINGRVGLPTDPDEDEGGLDFDPEELTYSAAVSLGLPLDRVEEELRVRQSIIGLEQQIREYERSRDNVVIQARSAVRGVDRARLQLTLAERQVETNRRRQRGQELDRDNVTPQEIVDTQNALLNAENARDQAQADLRVAILNYLLNTGQMRVTETGSIDSIGGLELMDAVNVEEEQNDGG
ncbi:MAG: hypothetical protein Phyf2KO_17590 [Phycisphaerales bacterium]